MYISTNFKQVLNWGFTGLNYYLLSKSSIIAIAQIMITFIKMGLKAIAKLREWGSIISHHLDHSCLIYQEMFFRITFCLDWDALSMFDWLDANREKKLQKHINNLVQILFCLVWTRDWDPRLGNIVTFLSNSPIY